MTASSEPIAIIGIGCRFPGGVVDAKGFWRLLSEGGDAITEVPANRIDLERFFDPRPATPGRMMSKWGGFLDRLEEFDPEFFGISPREAVSIDPQQRLMLETAWEALEDAGQDVVGLEGSRTGVFVGQWLSDFESRLFADPEEVDFYMTTGSGRYAISGRLSYVFGLQGPSLTLDTACSSSLAAVHLAVRSLRSGESTLALAGGVNVILQPHISVAYSQSRMMAPDGRCKFGDARGDGYVRSEGAGLLVLKPLAKARADGDRIYALIRGSALNNDGHNSEMMGRPSPVGQEELLRTAYRDASVAPGSVSYIEAHGTGTRVGDPVELTAMGRVLAEGRPPDSHAWVGSVKTNIGHTEGAAGIAGLIKVALSMHHGAIPPSLHLVEPNPAVPWATLPVAIPRELQAWPSIGAPRFAGVSGFGIGGTNAHVVLQSVTPAEADIPPPEWLAESGGPLILPLSARSDEALRALAGRYVQWFEQPATQAIPLADICHSAATRRSHLQNRAAFVADDHATMIDALARFERGEAGVAQGVSAERPRVVFVFPGQGGQWVGMGRQLLISQPAFAAVLRSCDEAARSHADFSILEQLHAEPGGPGWRLDDIDVVQPVLAAIEIAYAQMWRGFGVEPDAVIGHSMGEVAAAFVAGVLSIDQAMQIICRRSMLMRRVSGRGAMALVGLSFAQTAERLAGRSEHIGMAVDNGPGSSVVSGDPEAVARFLEELESSGIFARLIKVDVASHSPQMESLAHELEAGLCGLIPGVARVPIFSTVLGEQADGERFDAQYWGWNLRRSVLFGRGVEGLLAGGATVFMEMGPHPVLLAAVQAVAAAAGRSVQTIATARRDASSESATLMNAVASAHVAGVPLDWSRCIRRGRAVELPLTPWVRERYWSAAAEVSRSSGVRAGRTRPTGLHPFLSAGFTPSSGSVRYWEATVPVARMRHLQDHRVRGTVLFPATGFCELMLAVARADRPEVVWSLRNLSFRSALALGDAHDVDLQVRTDWSSPTCGEIEVRSRIGDGDSWSLHCSGRLVADAQVCAPAPVPGFAAPECDVPVDAVYARLSAAGIEYGPGFRGVTSLQAGARGEATARLQLDAATVDPQASRFFAYPAMVDAALQALLGWLLQNRPGGDETIVPTAIAEFIVYRRLPVEDVLSARLTLHALTGRASSEVGAAVLDDIGDAAVFDRDGQCLALMRGVRFERLRNQSSRSLESLLKVPQWAPLPGDATTAGDGVQVGPVLLLADDDAVVAPLLEEMGRRGIVPTVLRPPQHRSDECVDRIREFCGRAQGGSARAEIVDAMALGLSMTDADDWIDEAWWRSGDALVLLARALDGVEMRCAPRVWLLTRDAPEARPASSAVSDPHPLLGQALQTGLGRVMANEYPRLDVTLVDLDGLQQPGVRALIDLFGRTLDERQIAWRVGQWQVLRLAQFATAPAPAVPDAASSYVAANGGTGLVSDLYWRSASRPPPGPREVEIEVDAAGLNFMNLLAALNMLPGYEGGGASLGIECAGRVVRVGSGVQRFKAGDAVVAVGPDSLARHVLAHEALVHPRPAQLEPEQAAGLPIAFLTAWYALCHRARLAPGERVLIHSALGGVGLAALQIARDCGAQVLATAGSEEKRARLRAMGIDHVFDSRSGDFAEHVMAATDGAGVDVVLNSLAGPAIGAGMRCLAPYGRFVELGKRDIYGDSALAMQPFRRNLSFFAVDLDLMMRERPDALGAMMGDLMHGFAEGRWQPLLVRSFQTDELGTAFADLMPGNHVGKHVVSMAHRPSTVRRGVGHHATVRADGSYLISGGHGALGLALAGWLAGRGAGCVVLLGRSVPSDEVSARLRDIETCGTRVLSVACDVSCEADLRSVLHGVRHDCPPLRGVFHAAGTLADAPLAQLTPETLRGPGRGKVLGAWWLDRLTAGDPIEYFMMFSSVAALFGTPGQGNYAAANAFLDALAHQRKARGLPALSVNLGPVADVGLAAAGLGRGESLSRLGFDPLEVSRVIEAIDRLLVSDEAQAACMVFDASRWQQTLGAAAKPSSVNGAAGAEAAEAAAVEPGLPERLRAAPAGLPRRSLMESVLREEVAEVLRLSAGRVPVDRPLKALGLDSLMALELRNRLERRTGLSLSPTIAWNFPTIVQIGEHLAERLKIGLDAEAPAAADVPSGTDPLDENALADLLGELESLTEEEARRLLADGGGR